MLSDRLYLFFMANYFAQGMIGIAYEPISYLLKEHLRLDAAQSGAFAACMAFPFVAKPLLGLVSDALPLGGKRRTPHLVLASTATAAGWLALALLPGYTYWLTLLLLTLVNVGIVFSDVLCDAVMVERGKEAGKTGSYQAVQIGTLYATLLATGLGGGWLAEHAGYRAVFALTSFFPLLILAATPLVRELPAPRQGLGSGLRLLASRPTFWAAALVAFLFNFSPFRGTAFFYFQNDALGFSKTYVGALTSVSGLAGVAGAAVFWRLCRGLDSRRLARLSVLAGASLTLGYLLYQDAKSALVLTALMGALEVVARLGLMDLAARLCPEGAEATSFALFISVFNLAAWASNALGGRLYADWSGAAGPHEAMSALILLSALCVASCWPLLHRLGSSEAKA